MGRACQWLRFDPTTGNENTFFLIMKNRHFLILSLGFGLIHTCLADTQQRLFPSPSPSASPTVMWDMEALSKPPETYSAAGIGELTESDGIRAIFYDSVDYNGKPTRVFAWLGIPESKTDKQLPGIVLVHGAGGTAFRHWVKLWMDRGYAAIAMDTGGLMPVSMEDSNRPKTERHDFAGVPSSGGGFTKALEPIEQQWPYHAVAAIIRANSLLRSLPQVDSDRIGITGISWGGILTELAAGADARFKFAAPVYGSGFLGENSFWLENEFQKIPPATIERWISLWDPSQYVGRIEVPVLFANGTNDKHFRPDSWQKTYRATKGPVTLSLKVRMPHGHPPVGDPKEVTVFADSMVKQQQALPKVTETFVNGSRASVRWSSEVPVAKVELVYTLDSGDWMQRNWDVKDAGVTGTTEAQANIPEGATAAYFNIHDERGCVVSSEHWDFSTR